VADCCERVNFKAFSYAKTDCTLYHCRLKSYIIVLTFGPKNQSFWNKSRKTQPIRTKFGRLYVDMSRGDNV